MFEAKTTRSIFLWAHLNFWNNNFQFTRRRYKFRLLLTYNSYYIIYYIIVKQTLRIYLTWIPKYANLS